MPIGQALVNLRGIIKQNVENGAKGPSRHLAVALVIHLMSLDKNRLHPNPHAGHSYGSPQAPRLS